MQKLEVAFFAACTLFVLLGGVFTVAAKNPIRGAMGLLTAILGIAGMYLLLAAELLAAIQVVVYAGAVVILFLFVIMLLGPSATEGVPSQGPGPISRFFGAAGFLLTSVLALWAVMRIGGESLTRMAPAPAGMGTIEVIGRELFKNNVVAVQVAGVLLLIAVVGAMAVARGKGEMLLPASSSREGSKPEGDAHHDAHAEAKR
jgi:NADH-quinone oxidoreductase subunit J